MVQDGRVAWERRKGVLRSALVRIEGEVSRRDDTLNVVADLTWSLAIAVDDWHRW